MQPPDLNTIGEKDVTSVEKKQVKAKRRLLTKALLLCTFIMSAALTQAWFTSENSLFMSIEAGTLVVGASCFNLEPDNSGSPDILLEDFGRCLGFNINQESGHDLKAEPGAVFDESNWEPNIFNAKLVRIANNGTLPSVFKLYLKSGADKNFGEILWFDFIPLDENGASERGYREKNMADIDGFFSAELPAYRLEAGEARQFVFVYGMSAAAGNTYQNSTFRADIEVRAVQDAAAAVNEVLP